MLGLGLRGRAVQENEVGPGIRTTRIIAFFNATEDSSIAVETEDQR